MSDQQQLSHDCATTVRMRQAAEANDLDGVVETMAADVVLRSPLTDRIAFRGRDEVRDVLQLVFSALHDMHYFVDVGDQRTRALFYRATVRGQPIEEAMRVELNDEAQIREFTIFYRPLPGLTAFAAAVGTRFAARRGRVRDLIARLLFSALALATRLGDRLVPWFA
jgi:hypothetical protein